MTGTQKSERRRGCYFFLSYAHSLPLEGNTPSGPDQWVRRFYDDLRDAVERRASPRAELDLGLSDQDIPPGANWKASLSQALGAAEVFVPLLSPDYVARSWPGHEWSCFRGRLEMAGFREPMRRFVPVLWIPLPRDQDLPGLPAALAVAGSEPEYAENGLFALLRLRLYRDAYQVTLGRIAQQIVQLAEEDPIGPSAVPDIDATTNPFGRRETTSGFTVAVAAPTLGALSAAFNNDRYGETAADWRPFSRKQELPLTAYAQDIAERMDVTAVISVVRGRGDRLGDNAGVILIDPWYAATSEGREALRSACTGLPPWVLPLLVFDMPEDPRTTALVADVRAILDAADTDRPKAARHAANGVSTLQDFISFMPVLIAEAERQFLHHGPVGAAAGPTASRPGLRGGIPDAPDS